MKSESDEDEEDQPLVSGIENSKNIALATINLLETEKRLEIDSRIEDSVFENHKSDIEVEIMEAVLI